MKQKDYNEAYIQWQKACEVCPPDASQNIYIHGVKLLKQQLKNEDDELKISAIQDSILSLYDRRMKYFPSTKRNPNNACSVLASKASDFDKFYGRDSVLVANSMLRESIDCLGAESSPLALSKYYVTSFYSMKSIEDSMGNMMKQEMILEYLTLQDYIDAGISNLDSTDEKGLEKYEKAKANIDEVFIAIANCDEMVPVLSQKVLADSTIGFKQKVLRLLNKKACTDNELFLPIAVDVHSFDATHTSAYVIGQEKAKNEDFAGALAYMEEAVELCADCAELETYLLQAGKIASFLGKSSTARSYAQKVLANNPESAEAYMLIGDAIAGAAKQCDDGALGSRLAYLRACDYYSMAISRGDEDIKATAQKKLNANSKQFPSVDEIFAVGKSTGDAITIPSIGGCPCAGESTTIRVR
jgi:tetratricopeptide (TPR) repeat protein